MLGTLLAPTYTAAYCFADHHGRCVSGPVQGPLTLAFMWTFMENAGLLAAVGLEIFLH